MLEKLLPPSHILWQPQCKNKKRVFEQVSILLENVSALPRDKIFNSFISRERKMSAELGNQSAIPQARIPNISKPLCVLAQLKHPIPYGGGNKAQTLLFMAVPENNQHLGFLAVFSEMLTDEEFIRALARCQGADDAHHEIVKWEKANPDAVRGMETPVPRAK